jgi:hypothetical protein
MTRLDSILLQVDYSHINQFNWNNPLVKTSNNTELNTRTGEIESYNTFQIKKEHFGYSGINQTSGTIGGKVNINLSAKILDDNYYDGININNIEQVIDTFNFHSILKLNKNDVIDSGQLLTCDSTEMLYPEYEIEQCLHAMMLYRTNPSYQATPFYDKGKGQTVVLQSLKNKSIKRRYLLYNKYAEISRNTNSNKQFLAQCKNPLKILNDAKKALRSELNNSGKSEIRKRFGVVQPDLKLVLESNKKINYNFLKTASIGNQPLDLFIDSTSELTVQKTIERLGYISIIERFNKDIELIKSWLTIKYNSRTAVYKKLSTFQEIIYQLNEQDIRKVKKEFKSDVIINHLLQLMKAA